MPRYRKLGTTSVMRRASAKRNVQEERTYEITASSDGITISCRVVATCKQNALQRARQLLKIGENDPPKTPPPPLPGQKPKPPKSPPNPTPPTPKKSTPNAESHIHIVEVGGRNRRTAAGQTLTGYKRIQPRSLNKSKGSAVNNGTSSPKKKFGRRTSKR